MCRPKKPSEMTEGNKTLPSLARLQRPRTPGPTCVADSASQLTSAQRQDTAAVRMAAAVLPACHCRLGTKMSFTTVSR